MIFTVTLNPVLDRTLTVSRILFDEMVRAASSRVDWGGKGFNVSRALQALGVESVALGFVGGATGQTLENGLRELGIATDLIQISGDTRTNIVIVEAETGRYIKVNEAGPRVTQDEVSSLLDRVRARAEPGDFWILSGSLPPGVPKEFYAQLIGALQAQGALTVLDSSGDPLRLGSAANPYLIKPNRTEAAEVTGQEIQSEADELHAARSLLAQGVQHVALSLGPDGLLLASLQQAVWARPPHVAAKNPVGAGDALLAGVAWALTRGVSVAEVARWGVSVGTAAAMREGVSFGGRAEVEAYYDQVRVEPVGIRP
jgi:1-phosphofructokinase family hexose kinase